MSRKLYVWGDWQPVTRRLLAKIKVGSGTPGARDASIYRSFDELIEHGYMQARRDEAGRIVAVRVAIGECDTSALFPGRPRA